LHASERGADNEIDVWNADLVERATLRAHDVADGDDRKRFAGLRSGGTVATSDGVDANNRPLAQIEWGSLYQKVAPPIRDARRSGERVRNERDLAPVLARLAIDGDALIDRGEDAAAIEFEITDGDGEFFGGFASFETLAPQDDTKASAGAGVGALSFQMG
jgi:hypothetical protein